MERRLKDASKTLRALEAIVKSRTATPEKRQAALARYKEIVASRVLEIQKRRIPTELPEQQQDVN